MNFLFFYFTYIKDSAFMTWRNLRFYFNINLCTKISVFAKQVMRIHPRRMTPLSKITKWQVRFKLSLLYLTALLSMT